MPETEDRVQLALDQIAVAPRMERMATLFGAAAEMAGSEAWRSRDMTTRCIACRHTTDCARVLGAADADTTMAGFCPNVGHFRTLAARRDGASNLMAPVSAECLTWPDREAGWDRRCDSPFDN